MIQHQKEGARYCHLLPRPLLSLVFHLSCKVMQIGSLTKDTRSPEIFLTQNYYRLLKAHTLKSSMCNLTTSLELCRSHGHLLTTSSVLCVPDVNCRTDYVAFQGVLYSISFISIQNSCNGVNTLQNPTGTSPSYSLSH